MRSGSLGSLLGRRARRTLATLIVIVAVTSSSPATGSAEPAPTLADYQHTTWSARDGVPPVIAVMAQTTDGWLWFGSPSGLYRFDGVRFERVEIDARDTARSPGVTMLYASRSGELVIGTQEDGVFFLKDGRFVRDDSSTTRSAGYIFDIDQDADGDLWVTATNGLVHFDGRRWESIGRDRGFPSDGATSVGVDAAGTVWVSTLHSLVRRIRGRPDFEVSSIDVNGYSTLLRSPDGATWLHDQKGNLHLLAGAGSKPRDVAVNQQRSLTEMFDNRGNFWLQDRQATGQPLSRPMINYGSIGKYVNNVLEDRQGNIWICSGDATVHRLRHASITTFFSHASSQLALPTSFGVDDAGRVWMAMSSLFGAEEAEGVWMFDGTLHHVQPDEIHAASAIARSADGSLWVGGRDGLWRLEREHDRFERAVALPEKARGNVVKGIAPTCAGGLWVSAPAIGLVRHDGTRWRSNGGIEGLPTDSPPPVLTCDAGARLWIGYADGRLARIENDRLTFFGESEGLRVGAVTSIHVGPTHSVIAGEHGLAEWRVDRFVSLPVADPVAVRRATGIAETASGDLWVNNMQGLAHLAADDVTRARSASNVTIPVESFDASDGYPSPGFSLVNSTPSMVATVTGQIVMSGNDGIASIDPARVDHGRSDAPLVIRSVIANGLHYVLAGAARFGEGTRELEVDYAALDYSHPERVRFRYRLAGVQEQWVDAGSRREAFYTNLDPGSYRFIVNATTDRGTWSDREAAFDFVIPPTFVQSRIFFALCIATALALLGLAYRMRLRAVVSRERLLVDNRLRERERIARELHDTLLQGTQGLIIAVQAAAHRVSVDDPVRAMLEGSLTRANRVMAEGRDRIQDLRSADDAVTDLPRTLASIGEELAQGGSARFEVSVAGEVRDLVPAIASEIVRIVREALLNAFRHADAEAVELDLTYADDAVVVRVRDDGRGFATAALDAGVRREHWGLPGMRERAERIGATFGVWSREGAGTEIDLRIPAAIAYPKR